MVLALPLRGAPRSRGWYTLEYVELRARFPNGAECSCVSRGGLVVVGPLPDWRRKDVGWETEWFSNDRAVSGPMPGLRRVSDGEGDEATRDKGAAISYWDGARSEGEVAVEAWCSIDGVGLFSLP